MKTFILVVACQMVAAVVVVICGHLWLFISPQGGDSMLAGWVIGLLAILAAVASPLAFGRK